MRGQNPANLNIDGALIWLLNGMANFPCADGRLRELALFAGAGGGIIAGQLLGFRTVCAVELDSYAASVLISRQNSGDLEPFPLWDDVRTFDGKPWNGCVDVVSGGFPCTDISCAGQRAGIDGEASGLWSEMARIIGEVRPHYAFVENAADLPIRGLDRVLCDLAAMGLDAAWGNMPASAVGAPHERKRTWLLAAHTDRCGERPAIQRPPHQRHDGRRQEAQHEPRYGNESSSHLNRERQSQPGRIDGEKRGRLANITQPPADTLRVRLQRAVQSGRLREADAEAIQAAARYTHAQSWFPPESGLCGVVHGMAVGLDDAA